MVETLRHRGPDQQGIYSGDLFSFGAARLKILDLESGDQPIVERSGECGIVFNGEIYNHHELRSQLEKLGHKFASHSDTETVLKAFLQWDVSALSMLRGMFALAFWNVPEKRIVLARDRMGIKPVYFAQRGEDIYFGSELKSILVHREIERKLSLEGLECYLSLNYIPSPWTLIKGIKKLSPGCWMEWKGGNVRTANYWELPYGNTREVSLEEAKDELDALLTDSLKEHMLSDVPLGVWLSGGIDSTSILHYAAKASHSPLKTFSISFSGHNFDESDYIRQAVEKYGTDHEQLDLNPGMDLVSAIELFAYYSDEPSADAGALPVWFLSKLCKKTTTVALSGEGGDELFGGYLTYRADSIARYVRRFPKTAISAGLSLLRFLPVSKERIGFDYKVRRLLEGSLMPPERAHVYWNGTFGKSELSGITSQALPDSLDEVLKQVRELQPAADNLAPYLWLDQRYFLPDDILTKTDRMSMAHSVEVRPPFLDHRIVEFAASLPIKYKIAGSAQKIILKELMKDKLPASILKRRKIGFDIPAHEWLRGPLLGLMNETFRIGASKYGHIFCQEAIEDLRNRHLRREINVGYHLWGLLILFLWMNEWDVEI